MEIRISDVIKEKRRQTGVSQEVFAEAFNVSIQAVSKWETQSSLPDITLLPKIAEYLNISMDELFFGTQIYKSEICRTIPDDGKLRVVQYRGNTPLKEEDYDPNIRFVLEIPEDCKTEFNIEIQGSADIKGNINGNATANGGINCGHIGQSATADGGINCGHIGQSANAAGNINCGNVGCDANAGNDIACGDIGCNAAAQGGNIRCNNIKGEASCGGNIIYEDSSGNHLNSEVSGQVCIDENIPDDGIIRIVQYEGRKLLTKNVFDQRLVIPLKISEVSDKTFGVEVWGNAKIDGSIGGDLNVSGNADCLSVAGNVSAGGNVCCETISGDVSAGNDILNCGIVGVDASAGRDITCGTIGVDALAGRDITCGSIGCDASAQEGNIHCKGDIGGNATAGGNITCEGKH